MEKEKNNTPVVVILGVLVGVLLVTTLLFGYLVFSGDDVNTNESSNDEVSEKDESKEGIELDINSVEVQYLHDMTEFSLMVYAGINKEVYGNDKLIVSEMSDSYKQNIASNFYAGDVFGQQSTGGTVYVDASHVKKAYDLIFGEGYYKKDLPAKYHCLNLNYDASLDRYKADWGPCGVAGADTAYEKVLNAVKFSDRIEITVGVLFSYFEDGYYADLEKTKKLTYDGNPGSYSNAEDKLINDNIDVISQYTYTFKLNENGFYNYYSVERVKN